MTIYMQDSTGFVFTTDMPHFHTDATKISAKDGKAALAEQARGKLAEMLKPGVTVYTSLKSVSSSGMSRTLSVLLPEVDDKGALAIRNVTHYVADLLGLSVNDNNALKIAGAGMDMGYDVVHRLGARIWPNGTDEPHSMRNGEPDRDGGYALRHAWI